MDSSKIFTAMQLSAAAYKDIQPMIPDVKFGVIDSASTGVQCFLRKQGSTLSIAFRGTDSPGDWITDVKVWKKTIPYGNSGSLIRVHAGFINAYKSPSVRDVIQRWVDSGTIYIKITGHSLGAALAVLCAVDIEYNFPDRQIEVVLFGCPRVGNSAFKKSYNKRVFNTVRVENGNDIVTKLPLYLWGYRHVGAKLHVGAPSLPMKISANDHALQSYYQSLMKKLLPC